LRGRHATRSAKREALDLFLLTLAIQPDQFGHMLSVDLRRRETQLFFKTPASARKVPVFTEDERYDEPVVARAHLPVGAVNPW